MTVQQRSRSTAALVTVLTATLTLGALTVGPRVSAMAPTDVTQWRYARRISAGPPGATVLELDRQVLASASADLVDLRIFDATKQEIPWREVPTASGQTVRRRVRIIDLLSDDKRGVTSFVADLGQAGQVTNRLTLTTTARDFFKRLTFSASDDLLTWRALAGEPRVGYIYDLSGSGGGSCLTVDYPETSQRYLRVEMADLGTPPLTDLTAELSRFTPVVREEELVSGDVLAQDTANNDAWTVLDLGCSGTEVSSLRVTTSVESFRRPVVIEGSNDRVTWTSVSRDAIYRAADGERLRLPLPGRQRWRFYRVTVLGGDSPALVPEGVAALTVPRRVVFLRPGAAELFLLYGNAGAGRPAYDLTPLQRLTSADAAPATLGRQLSVMTEPETVTPVAPEKTDANAAFWRFERTVTPPATGFVAVALDGAVLAGARQDLTDLRLADDTGAAIAYTIRRRESAPQAFTVTSKGGDTATQWWTLDLGARNAPSHLLRLSAGASNFSSNVTVCGSNDGESWQVICLGAVRVAETIFGREENLTITYPDACFRYVQIIAGTAGQIQPVEVRGFPRELIFFAAAGRQYRLHYGNPEAAPSEARPELFVDAFSPVRADAGALGAVIDHQPPPRRPWFLRPGDPSGTDNPASPLSTYGLWTLLGILVIGLSAGIAVIFRRLARNARD